MKRSIARTETPEGREIGLKRAELAYLEGQLADRELELATLDAELVSLQGRYVRIVGRKYAELDAWRARIAEEEATRAPHDSAAKQKAEEAAGQARRSATESGYQAGYERSSPDRQPLEPDINEPARFEPTDELKQLYRRLARLVHPDLARDARDHERRTRRMAEVNAAYRAGDLQRLRLLLREAENAAESVAPDTPGAELIRLIREIDSVRRRLSEVATLLRERKDSDMGRLHERVRLAESEGKDLLWRLAAEVADSIVAARATWRRLMEAGRA